jgi:hypothetical protein
MNSCARTVLALLALVALACGRREAPPAPATGAPPPAPAAEAPPPASGPRPIEVASDEGAACDVRFGLALKPGGGVETPVLSFAAGDPVCVALALPSGARARNLSLRWEDVEGRPAGEASVAVAGDPPRAALCLPGAEKLPRGTYSLDVTADGRALASSSFVIADIRQSERVGGA